MTPVSINTVNQLTNNAYYLNNEVLNGNPAPFDIQYDGFTRFLEAVGCGAALFDLSHETCHCGRI